MAEDVWVTQKKKHVPMREMDHGHMLNSMAWVARNLEKYTEAIRSWDASGEPDDRYLEEDAIFRDEQRRALEALKDRQAMLAREWDRRFCLVHSDCRETQEIGQACAATRAA